MSQAAFEEGLIVARYLLGKRSLELELSFNPKTPRGYALMNALTTGDYSTRAQALAAPLARLIATTRTVTNHGD